MHILLYYTIFGKLYSFYSFQEAIKASLSGTDVSNNISDDKPFSHQLQITWMQST